MESDDGPDVSSVSALEGVYGFTDASGKVLGEVPDGLHVAPDEWPMDASLSAPDVAIRQEFIKGYEDKAFVLYNVLSAAECAYLIEQSERVGLEAIACDVSYRNCSRLFVRSPDVAKVVMERVAPFCEPITVTRDQDHCVGGAPLGREGHWTPMQLNPFWRLCRYVGRDDGATGAGGHFGAHYDGTFMIDERHRSLKTCMLYLNDGFDGGCTDFLDSQPMHRDGRGLVLAPEHTILHSVKPVAGMALIFNHAILHQGNELLSGRKYILRSDIVYKRAEADSGVTPAEREALLLYQRGEALESDGKHAEAAEMYRRAFKRAPTLEQKLFS